ncbi:IS1 family transposase [Candidatus Poribacteria bacterium]|nr:IS1 family transposase [Candidatus Poribacteria bacterium]
MPACKNCRSQQVTRNGFIRSKQRYRCKTCGYNFVSGDERTNPQTVVKRAFAVILYVLGSASYRSIAQLFDVSISTVSNWLTSEIVSSDPSQIPPNCRELEFDEMRNLISARTRNARSTAQFLVEPVESLSGLSVIVMLIPPTD